MLLAFLGAKHGESGEITTPGMHLSAVNKFVFAMQATLMLQTALLLGNGSPQLGEFRVIPRSTHWTHLFTTQLWEVESVWRLHFRIQRTTFEYLLLQLGPHITGSDAPPNPAVEPHVKLLLTLYWLAQLPMSYAQCGMKFGVAASTATKIILQVCKTINRVLAHWIDFDFSDPAAVQAVIDGFQAIGSMPHAAGAIDCTHFVMESPEGGSRKADYFDRNKNYSIVMQAIVDAGCRFLSTKNGVPGSVHDSRILNESSIYDFATSHEILSAPIRAIGNINARPYLL